MTIDWKAFKEGMEKAADLQQLLGNVSNMDHPQPQIGAGGFSHSSNPAPAPVMAMPYIPRSILTPPKGEVNSMNRPVAGFIPPKIAGLIDSNVLRSVLTAKAINGATNLVGGTQGVPQQAAPAPSDNHVALHSENPEIKKLLADPQTRQYLEDLLNTQTASHGH